MLPVPASTNTSFWSFAPFAFTWYEYTRQPLSTSMPPFTIDAPSPAVASAAFFASFSFTFAVCISSDFFVRCDAFVLQSLNALSGPAA